MPDKGKFFKKDNILRNQEDLLEQGLFDNSEVECFWKNLWIKTLLGIFYH